MKLIQLLKKDKRSKKEIYEKAFDSCSFDYTVSENKDNGVEKEPFSEAIKQIPNLEINMQEVDFYA